MMLVHPDDTRTDLIPPMFATLHEDPTIVTTAGGDIELWFLVPRYFEFDTFEATKVLNEFPMVRTVDDIVRSLS